MSLDDRGDSVRVLERGVIRTVERGVHRSSQFSSVMSLGDANCQCVILGTATWDMYGCHAEVLALFDVKAGLAQVQKSLLVVLSRVQHIRNISWVCVVFLGNGDARVRYRKESPRACAEQQTRCRSKGRVLSFLHLGRGFGSRSVSDSGEGTTSREVKGGKVKGDPNVHGTALDSHEGS